MDPYNHAISARGEGFQCDEISDLDQHAANQAAVAKALEKRRKREGMTSAFLAWLRKIVRK